MPQSFSHCGILLGVAVSSPGLRDDESFASYAEANQRAKVYHPVLLGDHVEHREKITTFRVVGETTTAQVLTHTAPTNHVSH